jgi:hypothetical protein
MNDRSDALGNLTVKTGNRARLPYHVIQNLFQFWRALPVRKKITTKM